MVLLRFVPPATDAEVLVPILGIVPASGDAGMPEL